LLINAKSENVVVVCAVYSGSDTSLPPYRSAFMYYARYVIEPPSEGFPKGKPSFTFELRDSEAY
ncbi:MAG: hypothetical protein ACRD3Q_05700, partial [Terriglobales bacterium]